MGTAKRCQKNSISKPKSYSQKGEHYKNKPKGIVFLQDDPKNVAVITTKQVVYDKSPIVRVFHDEDGGMWQFLDANEVNLSNALVVALDEIVNIDITISEVAKLPCGWAA